FANARRNLRNNRNLSDTNLNISQLRLEIAADGAQLETLSISPHNSFPRITRNPRHNRQRLSRDSVERLFNPVRVPEAAESHCPGRPGSRTYTEQIPKARRTPPL